MSHKLLNIICALTLVLGASLIAKAEVQNVRVGGDIEVRGIWQQDMDLIAGDDRGGDNTAAATDLYYAVTRAYISAELTDNVSTNIRFLNDRVWGEAFNWMGPIGPAIFGGLSGPTGDEVAIDLAYLTLSEIYDYPMSIYIGRQEIKVGEGFLIGDAVNDVYASDTKGDGNADTYVYGPRKAFDAIRAQWSYEPHTIDLIIAKVNEDYAGGIAEQNLYGINWNYDGGMYGIYDIGFFIDKQTNPTVNAEGDNITNALSVRGEGELPQVTTGTLVLKGEIVKQWGRVAKNMNITVHPGEDGLLGTADDIDITTKDKEKLDAWGGYIGAEYTFDNPYTPYIGASYIWMSGDKPNTDAVESFNPLYEDERYGELADAKAGGRATNAKIFVANVGFNPTESVNIDLTYYVLDEFRHAVGGTSTDSRNLGREFDLSVGYDYSEDVSFGLLYASFAPGKAITQPLDDAEISDAKASEILGSVKVTF